MNRIVGVAVFVLMSISAPLWAQSARAVDRLPELTWQEAAADNLAEIERALQSVPEDQRAGMDFLVNNMPADDLQSLKADFLLENCDLAYRAWRQAPWHGRVDEAMFFNYILPYACVNERRDPWRKEFSERFQMIVAGAETPAQAAVLLNQKIFEDLGVSDSKDRPQAVQSPAESMAAGAATSSGLSILLIDACRSQGIPARLVGVPMWSDNSGNHAWVEIWDGEWRFTGANEPSGNHLNVGWFAEKAAQAERDEPYYAVFAASFKKTHVGFPRLRPDGPLVFADNVTDFYTAREYPSPYDTESTQQASLSVLEQLREFLAEPSESRGRLNDQEFAKRPIPVGEISQARNLLWDAYCEEVRATRQAEMEARLLKLGEREMPFWYQIYGDEPQGGRSLFISMHGGGNGPARMNDRQWENQKRLYTPQEGVYVAPRAPTNTWNLWHEAHIDPLFDRLIANLIVFENVNPDRVYLLGYSAGGDGVYQLAPRMADRLAAASMMAGHPNEASPFGLRNLPFAIHVGGDDAAYDRNKVAAEWGKRLDDLQAEDREGYPHLVKIHEGKGHWMDREDAEAIEWMTRFVRNPYPDRVVWRQDDVTHNRFYWLAVDSGSAKGGSTIAATRDGQTVSIESGDVSGLTIRFHESMVDLAQPVVVQFNGAEVFSGKVVATIEVLDNTLRERGDPRGSFAAEITVRVGG